MPTMKITDRTINAIAPPSEGEVFYWDTTLRGFGYRMRIGAHGKVLKSFICQYKRPGGSRRMTLDSGGALNAEQARAEAKKILGAVALGQDPQADKTNRSDKDRHTLRSVIDQYLASKKSEVRPRTFTAIEGYLTGSSSAKRPRRSSRTSRSSFKSLHSMPIDTITRRDVAACITAIKNKSGAATAGAARAALSAFFVWAIGEGLAETNPVIGTNKPETNGSRERVLSDDELARVWRACDDGSEHSAVVKMLILTGCRRQEIGDLCWSWFAPDMSSFTIPAAHSKNGRPHTLPVMPMMREVVDNVPHMATRDQLFGERSHGFTRWHCKPELDARSGVTGWTLHDLRRTVATRMADLGWQPHVIDAVLNHQSGSKRGISGVYNKSPYANEVRNALATWHDHLRTIIAGSERKLVPFQQTA